MYVYVSGYTHGRIINGEWEEVVYNAHVWIILTEFGNTARRLLVDGFWTTVDGIPRVCGYTPEGIPYSSVRVCYMMVSRYTPEGMVVRVCSMVLWEYTPLECEGILPRVWWCQGILHGVVRVYSWRYRVYFIRVWGYAPLVCEGILRGAVRSIGTMCNVAICEWYEFTT